MSKPSLFQPLKISASSIKSKNVFSKSSSLSNKKQSECLLQISSAVSQLIDLGGIAKVTNLSIQSKYTLIAVIALNGSSGRLNPRSGSKSTSISKNAVCNLGGSAPRKFVAKHLNTGLKSLSQRRLPPWIRISF